jgi:hypothetical protein
MSPDMKGRVPIPATNITFDKYARRVDRLNRRTRLLQRQVEILCEVVGDWVQAERTRTLLAQIQNLQEMSRRHEQADANGGD